MKRRYDLLYAIGALVSSPVLAFGLLRTGKWRTDWRGRFGRAPRLPPDTRPTLLLHGVSVGEINATRALVTRLDQSDGLPVRVVISATTNTGFDRAKELYGSNHSVVRFPFDFSWMVGRFLDRLHPSVVALMELEVWPNLAQECGRRGIPLVVINGRLSDSSFGTYRWARRWVRPMFRELAAVAAQTEEYARRFRELGTPPEKVTVTDTMKWDTVKLVDEVEGAAELANALGIDPARPLVVAGSTGPGEEELLIRTKGDGVQLLLVPRKPERFEEVARLAPEMVRRSERPDGSSPPGGEAPRDLFLLDTMGELTKAYALADVAVVGRSFVPLGGSDPIEPIALGKPTLIGPRHDNFREVVAALEETGGLTITDDPMPAAQKLLEDPVGAKAMAEAGRSVVRRRQGATDRHAALLRGFLAGEGARPGPGGGSPGSVDAAEEAAAKEGAGMEGAGKEAPKKGKKGKSGRIRRWALGVFAVYLAAGYLTSAFRRVEAEGPVTPTFSLPLADRVLVSGVFSVHTERSHDAQGTREQVGAAGASAGLDFVVLGDHPPDPRRPDWALWDPVFEDGVLVDGGVELRAPETGKVLAMGVDSVFKRWEGGLGAFTAFLDRQGATSMVVHGRGPRGSERWEHARFRGLQGWEVLDLSESARARVRGPWGIYHLVTLVVGYPLGLGDEALLHMMREGFETPSVAAYDSIRMSERLTATAGLNVHPKVTLGPILLPGYGPFFRTLVGHVAVEGEPETDAAMAEAQLAEGIRRGEVFISLGHERAAEGFRLRAVVADGYGAPMGADVPAISGMALRGGFETDPRRKVAYRILRNGRDATWILGPELEWALPRPGLYRVEVYTYSARVGNVFFRLKPWIFANPMRIG